jgi:hypothetical protein
MNDIETIENFYFLQLNRYFLLHDLLFAFH